MHILLIVLGVIAAIIVFVLILALLVERDYRIERSVVINKPVTEVFSYLRLLRNQDNYSKWVMADPSKQQIFKGTDGTVGFIYGWNGDKQAGEGEQEIISIRENEEINIQIRFVRPFKMNAYTPFRTNSVSDGQTKVTWGMHGRTPYPMNIMTMMMKGVLAKDLDTSLNNLKRILEKN